MKEMKTRRVLGVAIAMMVLLAVSAVPAIACPCEEGDKELIEKAGISGIEKYGVDPLLYDAQGYASNTGVSIDEALRLFQLQEIAGKLDAELSTNETGTFAGLWVEHTPEFRVVVQFTRDGEETIKPYLKQHTELANIVEVRTANVSLADLQRAQANASYSARALDIPVESGINVYNNSVELYLTKADRSRFDDALQRREVRLSDKVRVITVEAEAMGILEADIYGGLPLSPCTSGFSVKKSDGTKGITSAGHCPNTQTYNGDGLTFESEKLTGSYDIQWYTTPGYTVTNKIRWWSDGTTRDITATKSRSSQVIGGYVCKYGKTSHYTCGYISDKNFEYHGQATFIRVNNTAGYDDLSSGGDSGGPWFLTGDAYGTHVGAPTVDPNDAIYMAVNYVESGLGVTVMTS